MKLQRLLAAITFILFLLTFLPWAVSSVDDHGAVTSLDFYSQIAKLGMIELPISGLFTLISLGFALGLDRWRLLTAGIWLLIAGLWPLAALVLRYHCQVDTVRPMTWCILFAQVFIGTISIALAAYRKRWNNEGKPMK